MAGAFTGGRDQVKLVLTFIFAVAELFVHSLPETERWEEARR